MIKMAMKKIKPIKKLRLYGFNNLTKTLSFNLYDINHAKNPINRQSYIEYIDEQYNSQRLTEILSNVANIIGANILNISSEDYDPQGASVTILVSEVPKNKIEQQHFYQESSEALETPGPLSAKDIVGHLDKSHLTVHTYPESHPANGISTFRADIDVSTCGQISPLKALNYLLHEFNPDIVIADYRVRGFTRDLSGKKHFIDHKINSIQNFITDDMRDRYQMIDVNIYQDNFFSTRMILKEFDLDNYLFGQTKKELMTGEKKQIKKALKKEMLEIFYGKNFLA